jgi:hypothetical protein
MSEVIETRKAKAPRGASFPVRKQMDGTSAIAVASAPTNGSIYITGIIVNRLAAVTAGKLTVEDSDGTDLFILGIAAAAGTTPIEFPQPCPVTEGKGLQVLPAVDWNNNVEVIFCGYEDRAPA